MFSVCVCVFYSVWCALSLFSFPSVYCIGLLSLYMWQCRICFHSLLSIFFLLSDCPLFIFLICPFFLFPLSMLSLFSLSSLNGGFSFPYFISPSLCYFFPPSLPLASRSYWSLLAFNLFSFCYVCFLSSIPPYSLLTLLSLNFFSFLSSPFVSCHCFSSVFFFCFFFLSMPPTSLLSSVLFYPFSSPLSLLFSSSFPLSTPALCRGA